jgi:hypothetical protein
MVFLTTQSENHGKEIALCLNTCRWTGFFGILHRMRHASNALKKDKHHGSTESGRTYRETDAQCSFTVCCRDGHDVCRKRQISEPSYKTGNDPGKPELMR